MEERCHGCGVLIPSRAGDREPLHPAAEALREPLPAPGFLHRLLRTRLLCCACLAALEPAGGPVALHAPCEASPVLEVLPAFVTDTRILALVRLLKFSRRERVAPWLARAMLHGLPMCAHGAEVMVVPVPMDRGSRRRRGFNQAESIAREIARLWGRPLIADAIAKPAATAAQSALGRARRQENVRGAFCAGKGAGAIAGRRVVLVDDLVTTGATVGACAGVLKRAGASQIRVICAGYRPSPQTVFPQS